MSTTTAAPARRTLTVPCRIDAETRGADGALRLSGVAIPYEAMSEDIGFFEVIQRGAFSASIEDSNTDVMLLWMHDHHQPLARVSAGNLTVREAPEGVRFEADLPNTTLARDAVELARTGVVRSMSFGFVSLADRWEQRDGERVRVVTRARLHEVSLVGEPAYSQTSAEARNLALQRRIEATVARSRKARTESPYRPDGDFSWYRDLATLADAEARWNEAFLAGRGPMLPRDGILERGLPGPLHGGVEEARDRLQKLAHEQRDITSASGFGSAVPAYLGDLFAASARAAGVLPNVLPVEPLPEKGMTVKTARITTGATVATVATENTSVSETSIVEAAVEEAVATVAGQQDMSWALLERAEPGIDSVLSVELGRALGEARDRLLLAGTGTPPEPHGLRAISGVQTVSYTSATPTAAGFVPKLAELAARVAAANGSPATHVLAHPRRLAWLASNLSSTFPLQDVMLGLNVVPVTAIGTTYGASTNADECYVIVRDELPILLGPVRFRVNLDWSGSGTATARLTAWQYLSSLAARRPEAVGVLSGTGLAAWF